MNIDVASASFMDYDGDSRAPRLDLKLTNMGDRPAFITEVRVDVKKTWRLKDLPQFPGVVVPPGHNYVVRLHPSDRAYQITENISEGLGKDDFGRFSLQFEEDPWPASNTIYLVDVTLFANSNRSTHTIADVLFFVTMYGTSFPDERQVVELIHHARSLGKNVDEQDLKEFLRENRRMILEADAIKSIKNPALAKLIESAKMTSLGDP